MSNDESNKIENDYVCHNHQTLASKCGCLSLDDFCTECGTQKTSSIDGKHCRICNW